MTSLPDRQQTVTLIQEAQRHGARLTKACRVIGISLRTYQRWTASGEVVADRRPEADRPTPHNKLTPDEEQAILALCNASEYRSRPPAYIVADQADQSRYLASELTLYRVLKAHDHAPSPRATASASPPTSSDDTSGR